MSEGKAGMLAVVITGFRVLFFRATREELLRLDGRHLAYGLLWTWLVGVGRRWDHEGYAVWQYLGLTSLAIVFILSGVLALFLFPLKPRDVSFLRLLTFVSLTSPPAILYAIPVEKYFDLTTANEINATFLLVVAIWRIALVVFLFVRLGMLGWFRLAFGLCLPVMITIVTLFFLNLDGVVFNLMAGIQEKDQSPMDDSFLVLFLLGILSIYGVVPVFLIWTCMVSYSSNLPDQSEILNPSIMAEMDLGRGDHAEVEGADGGVGDEPPTHPSPH